MNYQAFVEGRKTMLVAPAGYGKTHTIAECLKYTNGKQLILTHTHAGVASLKNKVKELLIKPEKYSIETISSFAQKYSHAFCSEADKPYQEAANYHEFMVQRARKVFTSPLVISVLTASYSGLFVDEYQDCTKEQHAMISTLSDSLPTHILCDPLQGIFDFSGDAVDCEKDLHGFDVFPELSTPHRWYREGNNRDLGKILMEYRAFLKSGRPISLVSEQAKGLFVINVRSNDIYNPTSHYRKCLKKLIENSDNNPGFESLLIIVPEYSKDKFDGTKVHKGNITDRAKIRANIDPSRSLKLLESIDDKSFYAIAKKADSLINGISRSQKKYLIIRRDILDSIFNKTILKQWFNNHGLKEKKSKDDKLRALEFKNKIDFFVTSPSALSLWEILSEAKDGLKLTYKRDEILFSLLRALKEAQQSNISVYEAMKNSRNTVRRNGRKIYGKCIGTTLLTKGLEFDTVAILDAHNFESHKHLYVALTRCCKNLIVFTEKTTLPG